MEFIRKIVKGAFLMKFMELPQEAADQDLEVLVLPLDQMHGTSPGNVPYDFSDLAGTLHWKGDAITEQRKLRDEW